MSEPKHLFLFDKNRLLILKALFNCQDDICGCDLVDKLGVSKHLISYHIKKLSEKGFVEEIKCGQRKNYKVKKEKEEVVKQALKASGLFEYQES